MHNKVQIIVCAYYMQHGKHSFSPAALVSQRLGGLCSAQGNEGHLRTRLFDTESQIHTITEWLRLDRSSGDHLVQLLCSEQGHMQHSAQDCVQSGFEYLQGWRLHNLSGKLLCTNV